MTNTTHILAQLHLFKQQFIEDTHEDVRGNGPFIEMLNGLIRRTSLALQGCDHVREEQRLTPSAWAFLDVWDNRDCQPSWRFNCRDERIEYICEYLRLRPHDRGAIAIATTEGLTIQHFADMYEDALDVDLAQGETSDWKWA